MSDAQIADRVRAARIESGLSQRAFADRIGVSRGMIGAIENGTKLPGRETLKRISDASGWSIEALLGQDAPGVSALTLTNSFEIRLILNFRLIPKVTRKNLSEIIEMAANVGRVIQKEDSPAKV